MACKWIIKDKNDLSDSVLFTFSTESDLDQFLSLLPKINKNTLHQMQTLVEDLDDNFIKKLSKFGDLMNANNIIIDKMFDISKFDKTNAILSNIELKIKHLIDSSDVFDGMEEESIKLHDHPDYVGVTELITEWGNPKYGWEKPIIEKLNVNYWRSRFIASHGSIELADNTIKSWKTMQEYGDDVHSIFQAVFQETELPKKFKHLTESQVDEFVAEAKTFKRELQDLYGINSKFHSEFNIATKDIDPALKDLLGGRGIAGSVDLLVVAEDGSTHLYDFKTSYKSPGDWNENASNTWHRNKKTALQNQLAGYNAILQQAGLENSTTHAVPIKMNYEYDKEGNIIGLNSWSREKTIDTVPETTTGSTYRNWTTMVPRKFSYDSNTLVEVDKKIQHLLPVESIISQKIERRTRDIEYYRRQVYRLKETDPQANQNGKHYKYKFYPRELSKPAMFWENDEQMEQGLQDYVDELKNVRANELDSIAINIQRAILGEVDVNELDSLLSDQKQAFLADQIRRYVRDGWSFIRDKNLNAFGIFIFQKDGRSEVIGITNQPLGTSFKLTRGSSILGKTRYDKDVNSKYILDATTGNMELIRLMTYIAENQDAFKDNKITQIKVINPWSGHKGSQYVELNSVLRYNYNLLVQDNQATFDGELKLINQDIFYGDVVSLLSIADELLADAQEKSYGIYEFDRKDMTTTGNEKYTEDWIGKQIWNLRHKYSFLNDTENPGVGDPRIWQAYNYLLRANLAITGLRTIQEFDQEAWINKGVKAGTYINSTGFSPSANIRMFDDIMQEYATEVRTKVEQLGRPLLGALNAFYKAKGKNRIIGGEGSLFKEWFVTNPDGTIHESFSVKDPSDASLSKESSNALKIWLDIMQKLRWPNATPEEIQKMKDTGVYYEVPLTEASFTKQAGQLGIFNAFKNKIAQYSELTEDVFAGETDKKMEWKNSNLGWSLYNKFNLDKEQRASKLRDKGVGFFETDLEIVMNQALVAYTKSNVSPKYISRLNALSVSLKLSESYGGQVQRDTREALEKLIKSKFYGESIIEGNTLQQFARWLGVIKKGLSFMSLGFNARSFLREFLQGTWMGISRAGLNNMPGVTRETYVKAYEFVLKEAHKNISSVSLLQQLDARFGVANYSLGNIYRKRRLDWTGIRNWNSDTAFWGSTSPDFQHRMTILIAKMMGEGVFDTDPSKSAYYLDKDGNLVYDWTRDKRFSICAEGIKSGNIPEFAKNHPEFAEQYSLYEAHIAELNRVNKKFKDELGIERAYQEGDALQEAYLPREIQAIKNYSDLLYGHYDDESRSLIHDMFLGSFFMQYKTFITSRVEQWALSPGTYNTELLQWEVDPITGEHLYRVHNDPDEDGRPNISIIRESQIENMEQLKRENRIERLYVWKGMPMEGIARSYIDFFKKMKGLNFMTAIRDLKNNPVERDNLILGLHDTLFASFMLMLITGIAGMLIDGEWTTDHNKIAREAGRLGWGPSFAYNVAYGSYTDFAIWNNAWSIFGDWNPPALTAATRLVNNAGAVILGNKTLFQAVTNTIGAAADLKGLANELANL